MNRNLFIVLLLLNLIGGCKSHSIDQRELRRVRDSVAKARQDSAYMATLLAPQVAEMEELIRTTDSATNALQIVFDAALVRFDSLSEEHVELDGKLYDGKSEISKLNNKLKELFKNRKMSEVERSKAQALITDLNREIDKLIKQ